MFNLFEILQSQAGPGMQSIGQQFGLTPDQSRNAMNALLPALAAGLQRSAASDPMGFGRMLGVAGANPYFTAPSQPQASTQPDFLGQLFGSSVLSQAVLQQASATSGIGQQALRQMLPVMAGMVVAGIVHVLVNQPPPSPAPFQRQPAPQPPEGGPPVAAFWNDWINQFLAAPDATKTHASAAAQASRESGPEPAPHARAAAPSKPANEGDAPFEAFQQMFQTGAQVQEQNARAMQDIFEAFWSPPGASNDAGAGNASQDVSKPNDLPTSGGPSNGKRTSRSERS